MLIYHLAPLKCSLSATRNVDALYTIQCRSSLKVVLHPFFPVKRSWMMVTWIILLFQFHCSFAICYLLPEIGNIVNSVALFY